MKTIKIAGTGLVLGAVAAGMLAIAAPASAATPAFEPDPNASLGSITFYNAAGHVITGGNDLNHLFDYAVASTPSSRTTNTATAVFAFPDHTKPDSSTWFKSNATGATTYPNTSAPAPINAQNNPTATATASDANLAAQLSTATLDQTAGYVNIVQIQLHDSGTGLGNGYQQKPFWATDIQFDKAAGTWQQVYPAPVSSSVSAITANPASPAPAGTTSVSLSATVTASDGSHPAGSVHLFNGSTDLGAATFTASTGAITDTATVADNGSYNYSYVFTPSGSVTGSTSPTLAYTVNGPAQATTTVVSGPTSTTVGTAVTIHADVKKSSDLSALPAGAGTVQFKVNGVNSGSPVPLTATGADFQYNPSGAGSATITATFTPTDSTKYVASSDNTGVTVTATNPAYAPAPQNMTVTVPQGTLVISTPYTVANPFKLGTMQLNSTGTLYNASAPFGDPNAPAAADPGNLGSTALSSYPAGTTANGVTITDTRAHSQGWTASAQTTDFTNPSLSTAIDGNNLTFTNVTPKYLTGNNLQAGDVTTNAINNFKTAKKAFATTAKGPGTVDITGVFNLTAPTSTLPGDYTATVTFTVA